ncbi:hypothetical protein [Aestuariibaculum sediminum]|uniref:Uncharacterized protein n=1 Tax=Aestuariibaculum sediminum TaxID=2770637 RepID=A0A8J6Q9V9_9FLAO|nr:hypothetical protein [Aestuariibaculum sediminum]MBD0832827.1 hypothetical protein [Aestuariibaculum sediminum]
MDKQLDAIYTELGNRLIMPMLFYLPKHLWLKADPDTFQYPKYDEYFDCVILIETSGKNYVLEEKHSYIHLMQKLHQLDMNMAKLIQLKEDLEQQSFKFFLDKYYQQLSFYVHISGWLNENVTKDINGVSEETLNAFKLQNDSFISHIKEFENCFLKTYSIKAVEEKFENIDISKFNPLKSINIPDAMEEKVEPTSKRIKKPKKILVTEEKAEAFLLKSVFNLEVDN